MASGSCATARHSTLAAATVETTTFTGDVPKEVEVYNRSAAGLIYFTTDGDAPTVGGDDCYVVGAGQSLRVRAGATTVKLISATTDAYSVTRVA